MLPDGKRQVIPSPNLFDAAVLSFDYASIINNHEWQPLNHKTPGIV